MNNQITFHLETLIEHAEQAKEKTSKILFSTYSDLCELEEKAKEINEQIKIVKAVYEAALQADIDAQQFRIKLVSLIQI